MKVALIKLHSNGYCPYTEHDRESLEKVAGGEIIMCDVRRKRNVDHHRKGFALLHAMFDNQDSFDDFDRFRDWVQIAAGVVDTIIGDEGKVYYKIKSLSFADMDQSEFDKVYNRFITVAVEKLGQDFALEFV